MVTVYTKPGCVQCDRTKWLLASEDIDFVEVDLVDNPEALAKIKDEWGFSMAPVVETEYDVWAGHRPDRIKQIAEELCEAAADD